MPDIVTPTRSREAPAPAPAVRSARRPLPAWLIGAGPLVLLALLVVMFLRFGPLGVFRASFPPVEELTVERVTLPAPGEMRLRVVNGGPEPVTIAQVLVDDAVWNHALSGDRRIGRLESREIMIPYPWVEGEPHEIKLVTSTGLTFSAKVEVATQTPSPDARYLLTFTLLGIYVGVIPVFLGLLWLPFLRRLDRDWLDFMLSLTAGLLLFLGVDALAESIAFAARVPGAFQGAGIVLFGLVGTPLLVNAMARRGGTPESPLQVAMLIAIAIGLHNFGEGLAIGAAYATGSIALGTFLVLGFLLHNTTEGLGIVAPLAREKPALARLAVLGLIAGAPTILGTWIGGLSYSSVLTTLFFAVGAGAIAQVVLVLWRQIARGEPLHSLSRHAAAGIVAGLLIMYLTGLFVPA